MKTGVLIKKIADFEVIITATEKEALILESNLIKRHKPKYNVILKDDKRYPSLKIDLSSPFPNLVKVRKIKKDKNLYFGPFSSVSSANHTLKFINKNFKLRKCLSGNVKKKDRPCLNYQMNLCLGPCAFDVDKREYDEIVKETILFLKGKKAELIKEITDKMLEAARKQEFEKAALLRDKKFAIERTLEKQTVFTTDFTDRDALGIAGDPSFFVITIFFIRAGKLIGTKNFTFKDIILDKEELLKTFILQYYGEAYFTPKEILIPYNIEEKEILSDTLSAFNDKRMKIIFPQKGEKKKLVKNACFNAENFLNTEKTKQDKIEDILIKLKNRLRLEKIPERIECFDNSNILGTNPVSCMVVFTNGLPDKSQWRKYKIKTVTGPDDYASMAEALSRRFAEKEDSPAMPDILMVDGGKGQLNIADKIIKGIRVKNKPEIIGIAKKDEKKGEEEDKVYKINMVNPVNFGKDKEVLFFLQRIRDEAHRFAISFHRKTRQKSSAASVFDDIPGIGPSRKKELLKHFKSIENMKKASFEDFLNVPKITKKAAENLTAFFSEKAALAQSKATP